MGHEGNAILPSSSSDEEMANTFSDFFKKKIVTIRVITDSHTSTMSGTVVMSDDVKFDGQPLKQLDVILDVILMSASKFCELPLITAIIDKLLAESDVPLCFKKPMLDHY